MNPGASPISERLSGLRIIPQPPSNSDSNLPPNPRFAALGSIESRWRPVAHQPGRMSILSAGTAEHLMVQVDSSVTNRLPRYCVSPERSRFQTLGRDGPLVLSRVSVVAAPFLFAFSDQSRCAGLEDSLIPYGKKVSRPIRRQPCRAPGCLCSSCAFGRGSPDRASNRVQCLSECGPGVFP